LKSDSARNGLARRARRLSDQETARRMLAAAEAMVNRTGLTVSLEHISFEDVIRDADVSRSAVYRLWPYKDLFFSELVKDLAAKDATPRIVEEETRLIRRVINEHLEWFGKPELRLGLVVELIRQLALFDFETISGSAGWRTYIALHATFMSLPDGELRDEVRVALARSEQGRTARVAKAWEQLAIVFGFRLRPELGASFETMATLLSASIRGLVILSLSRPEIAAQRVEASPFGAAGSGEWSLPAMAVGAIAQGFLELDPAVEWDEERLAAARDQLGSLELAGS
jgi:AcrR family transcriptional regulator